MHTEVILMNWNINFHFVLAVYYVRQRVMIVHDSLKGYIDSHVFFDVSWKRILFIITLFCTRRWRNLGMPLQKGFLGSVWQEWKWRGRIVCNRKTVTQPLFLKKPKFNMNLCRSKLRCVRCCVRLGCGGWWRRCAWEIGERWNSKVHIGPHRRSWSTTFEGNEGKKLLLNLTLFN